MAERTYTGTEFTEGFFLFVGLLWLVGALAIGGVALLGADRTGGSVPAESNATAVGEMPTQ